MSTLGDRTSDDEPARELVKSVVAFREASKWGGGATIVDWCVNW